MLRSPNSNVRANVSEMRQNRILMEAAECIRESFAM